MIEQMPVFIQQNYWFFIPVLIWSIFWKGMALWRSAQLKSKPWFVALLLINTMGLLEILYLFVFSRKKGKS